jgi:CubicO group peptidase (beta-lactamase class C family)
LKKNIFEPLQMSNTRFYEPNDYSDRNRSIGYAFIKSKGFERAVPTNLTPYTIGDGYLYSSVEDLYKWDKALYTTRLVNAGTLKQAFSPAIQTDTLYGGYGFGWFVTKRNGYTDIWHSGGNFGSTSYIHRLPEKRLTVIILTNRLSMGDLKEITNQIVDLYLSDGKASAVEQELLRLHREYNNAMNKGDRKTLDRLIAEDFIRTTIIGTNNKSEMPIESPSEEDVITEDSLKVQLYENTAVITGRINDQYKDEIFRVRFTEVWHKGQKGWQIVSSQLTPMQTQ